MAKYDSDYEIRLAQLQAMGGDVTKHYDSVYEIDLEILRLTEEGGGGSSDAIEDVQALPDASANKNKLVRLASDKKVYVSECSTSTEEVVAPESEQIDEAILTLNTTVEGPECLYKGEAYISDGVSEPIKAYRWERIYNNDNYFTVRPASEITNLNNDEYYSQGGDWSYDSENNVYIDDYGPGGMTIEKMVDEFASITLVKQTVTTETWAWKRLDYQPMQSITYAELKALRDNKQLVPGQQYRITDYVTTTAQENTQSAGHQFDIIVTADDVNKLNENARAINHPNYISAILFDSMVYERYPEGDDENGYAWVYVPSGDGFSTIQEAIENGIEWGSIEPSDLAYSETEIPSIGDIVDNAGDEFEVTDFSNTINIDYFANSKLESWELKYCLDNDTKRFSWAQEGQEGFAAIITGARCVYKRYPLADNTNPISEYSDFQIAWIYVNNSVDVAIENITDWNDVDAGNYCYTEDITPNINDGCYDDGNGEYTYVDDFQVVINPIPAGTGVIYYMKDEWNNQVYFDFKNIKIYSEDYGETCYLFGDDDESASENDGSMTGISNNNIVEGQVTDGVLTLDTNTLLWNQVWYQNVVEIPEYTAGEGIAIDNKVISNNYNASEALQIGNAYITDDTHYDRVLYNGTECTLIGTNGTFVGYLWLNWNGVTLTVGNKYELTDLTLTPKKASYITSITNDTYYRGVTYYNGYEIDSYFEYEGNNTFKVTSYDGTIEGEVIQDSLNDLDGDVHINKITPESQIPSISFISNELSTSANTYYVTPDDGYGTIVASTSTNVYWFASSNLYVGKSARVDIIISNDSGSSYTPNISGDYILIGDVLSSIPDGNICVLRGIFIPTINKWLVEQINQVPSNA